MAEQVNHKDVQKYYGKVLKTKEDLKTSACSLPIPPALDGCTVLDLGGILSYKKRVRYGEREISSHR